MATTKAPYHVGDTIRLLHDALGGTCVGDLPVIRVTRLSDGRSWRVEARRDHPSCPTVAVVVNEHGVDQHGYVTQTPGARSTLRVQSPQTECAHEDLRQISDHDVECRDCGLVSA